MPEQPPDPLHYDMRIPPPPDPAKHRGAEKPSSSKSESDAVGNNEAGRREDKVHGDDKEEKGKGLK
jgi:hypothetical protein